MPVRSLVLVVSFLSAASPLRAGYATRDAYLPIAGHASGADGHQYLTALWLTNPTNESVHAKVTAVRGADAPSPSMQLDLGPHQTRVFDPLAAPLFTTPGFAALHVESSDDVVAHARLYTTRAGEPLAASYASSFEAIPTQYAIGSGESALLQGVQLTADFRYKLYLIETAGHPLYYSLALLDERGVAVATSRAYLGAHQHRAADLNDLFPGARIAAGVLRITGINGDGRVIAGGVQVAAGSQDGTAYEMNFQTASRTRMTTAEVIAYVSVAAVVALALLRSLRARPRVES